MRVGGDVDPEQLEHEVAVEPQDLLAGLAFQLVGHQRGRCLRDRAAVAAECYVLDAAVGVELQLHPELVAAQRVRVEELEIGIVELPEVVGRL